MMQGQSSSSSTGEGGLEAVGQLLKDWSRSRKAAPAQPNKPPVVVPPPKKAAAAAAQPPSPWRSFPPAPPPPPLEKAAAAALSNEQALRATQQLKEEVQDKLAEEKKKEEREWYKMAAKEEYDETEETAEAKDQTTECGETMEDKPEEKAEERAEIQEEKNEEKTEEKNEDKGEEKNEDKAEEKNEEPDWGGSPTEESQEEAPQKKTLDGDSDSEGKLATMTEKELVRSLKVSYQAAVMNLQDAQKKEELLGLSRRGSSSCIQNVQDLKQKLKDKKNKQKDARDEAPEQEGRRKKRRKKRHHGDRRKDEGPWLCFTCIALSGKMQAAYLSGCGLGIPCRRENIHESLQKGKYTYIYWYILLYFVISKKSLQKGKKCEASTMHL